MSFVEIASSLHTQTNKQTNKQTHAWPLANVQVAVQPKQSSFTLARLRVCTGLMRKSTSMSIDGPWMTCLHFFYFLRSDHENKPHVYLNTIIYEAILICTSLNIKLLNVQREIFTILKPSRGDEWYRMIFWVAWRPSSVLHGSNIALCGEITCMFRLPDTWADVGVQYLLPPPEAAGKLREESPLYWSRQKRWPPKQNTNLKSFIRDHSGCDHCQE